MEKLQFGETAVLSGGKEFICFANLQENGIDYVYLVSNFKPLEVRFAKQTLVNGELLLELIEDTELKQHLYDVFKEKFGNQRGI